MARPHDVVDGGHEFFPRVALGLDDGVFVVKPDPDAFNEKETTEWLDSLPINVPRVRLIATKSQEGQLAITELAKFDGPATKLSDAMKRFRHFLVMEMVPGQNLDSQGLDHFLTGPGARTRLFMIGMLVAYDLVIYNVDRFPGVGDRDDNPGNAGNLMFRTDAGGHGRPIAIDQQVSGGNVEAHIVRLTKALRDPQHRISIAEKVVHFIQQSIGLDLAPVAMQAINDGIREGLAKLGQDRSAELRALKAKLETHRDGDHADKQLAFVTAAIDLIERVNPDFHQLLTVRDY
jgi:hypothetical protein